MKKVLVLNYSPRKKGYSAGVCSVVSDVLREKGADVTVLFGCDLNVGYCKGCGACKKKDHLFCVQKDDFTSLIPLIDDCDAIFFAAPVYYDHVPGPAKIFIDRTYCFWNPELPEPLYTVKGSKKIGVFMPCGAPEPYSQVAEWVAEMFKTVGITDYKYIVKGNLNDFWDAEDPYCAEIAEESKALASWLID